MGKGIQISKNSNWLKIKVYMLQKIINLNKSKAKR